MKQTEIRRKILRRAVFAAVIVLLCASALWIRARHRTAPDFFNTYFPDTAWTMAVYCGFGFLFDRGWRVNFPAALVFSYAIELSQLSSAPLLAAARATRLGGLILGYGFLWTDLVCYTVGALLCAAGEMLIASRKMVGSDKNNPGKPRNPVDK